VSLLTGVADASYPLYRLYDRHIGKMFKSTLAETVTISVDQGSSVQAVDRLMIPAGHNLAGLLLSWQYSDNGQNFSDALAAWTQADNLLINKALNAGISHRYHKFAITSPAQIPQVPELCLTSTYSWETLPARPLGPFNQVYNVSRKATNGGGVRFWKRGDPKQQRHFKIPRAGNTQRDNALTFDGQWGGCNSFWLCDSAGVWLYGELTSDMNMTEVFNNQNSFNFDFLEVLPI
jgi:hypothetical protein